MNKRTSVVSVLALGLWTTGCFGSGGDRVSAPSVNESLTVEVGAIDMPFTVECDGPPEDLAVLGDLCGADTEASTWRGTTDGGFATEVNRGVDRDATVLIYGVADGLRTDNEVHELRDELGYAAYVRLAQYDGDGVVEPLNAWDENTEPVGEGAIRTERAQTQGCTTSWVGQATLLWRSTTLRFAWSAANPC